MTIDGSLGWAVTYDDNAVIVTAALLGDANTDGVVDVSDFNLWNTNKFAKTGWSGGDFNGDGFADVSDFNIWNENKFTQLNPIPEPNAGWMFLTLISVCFVWARKSYETRRSC